MPSYQVTFFINLLSSDGHPFKCPQQVITFDAPSAECAIEAAEEQLCSHPHIRVWRHGAYQVEATEQRKERIGSGGVAPGHG
jgi:hypothetical protein